MKKIFFIIFLTILFVSGCSSDVKKDVNFHEVPKVEIESISVDDVKVIVDNYSEYDNVTIIDVRSVDEYESGHIKNAINLPLDIIENIDIPRDNKVIVYCQSGRRSNQAAIKLLGLGYENIYDMGGIINWPYDVVE